MLENENLTLNEKRRLRIDKELEEKINMVVDHIISTGDSYRKTAEYFSMNHFKITATTVCEYCKRYITKYPDKAFKLKSVIDKNREVTYKDKKVEERVYSNAKYLLAGNTIDKICEITGLDYWVVYRDLTERLPKLDMNIFEQVKKVLKNNKEENLKNHQKK